jgi:tripartite-type tricarboxylate transporter receptor subunit TctC
LLHAGAGCDHRLPLRESVQHRGMKLWSLPRGIVSPRDAEEVAAVRRLAFVVAFVMAGGVHGAWAQSYPSRVIKIIVPIAAGGPLDAVARTVGETLSERLKQAVVVENRPGAGGNIGIQAGLAADPDGYTLIVTTGSMLTTIPSLYKKPPFDPERDLRPITLLTVSSQTLAVHPSLPVNSLKDFIAFARKNPLSYATSGYGTPSHLTMEYLRMLADFPATPVTYRGLPPLMIDLLSGQVKAGFVATSGAITHVRQGKLKALGISTGQRSKLLTEIPTIAESGYPEFAVDSYIVLVASARIPDPVASLLESEARRAVTLPAFQKKFVVRDVAGVGSTSAEARAWIAMEFRRWAKVIKAANMQVN